MITLEIDSPQYDTYSGEIDSPVYHTQGDWLHGILYSGEIDSPGYHPQGDFTTIFNDWLSRLWYSGEIDLLGYYTLGDYLVGVSYPGEIFILMVELIKKIFPNLRAGADNLSLTDSPADFSLFFWLAPATKFCHLARYLFFYLWFKYHSLYFFALGTKSKLLKQKLSSKKAAMSTWVPSLLVGNILARLRDSDPGI